MSYEHDWNSFGKVLSPPFRKYIHCRGYFQYFLVKLWKRDFARKLNTLKMVWIWTPKWTSKKAFLKTPRGHFMVSLSKSSPSRHMSWQWNFFLITRASERWLSDYRKTSQKVFSVGNRKFCDFHKRLSGMHQNPVDMEIMAVASNWNILFSNVSKMISRHMWRWL